MEPFQTKVMGWWHTPTRPDQVGVNFTHILGKDCRRAEDLTAATIEGRRQAFQTVDVYRQYVPGMKNCWMSHTAQLIGTRESRRVNGLYQLTAQDVKNSCRFDDSIGYGSFYIDIHNCTGPGMDAATWNPPGGFHYQIPFRILVPQKAKNLLVAGRCASCTHTALGSLRVMPQCLLMGEAAGAAASQCIERGVTVDNVDIPQLQHTLRDGGSIVFDEDVQHTGKAS